MPTNRLLHGPSPQPNQSIRTRTELPELTIENLQSYLSAVAQMTRRGDVSIDVSDRLIACARALILAANGRADEPHTPQI